MSKRAAASGAASRKVSAKRPRHLPPSHYDVPEIPGVPPDLTPLLVEALGSATKFFQHAATPCNPFAQENNDAVPPSLVESILDRMVSRHDEEAQQKRHERMKEDCHSWLNAVKRHARSNVPLSCFRHLWDLQQDHGRVAVRRASLNLCGCLLQKSRECRMHVSSDDILLQWVTCVVEAKNVKASAEKQVSCWQMEAFEWLTHVSEEYGSFYPKFRVARQFLQQRCLTSMDITEGNSGANMADFRRTRDIALKYGDCEIIKVNKLIHRAHHCLDVLVPRMTSDTKTAESHAAMNTPTDMNNSDDDDDDIDWEDGDKDFDEGDIEDHALAVDRTLAAIASAGGLQGGRIEISLETREGDEDESPYTMNESTLKILQKTVELIESRHMKRLSCWVDGLIKSDQLSSMNEKSLMIMSADDAKKRADLLHQLLDKKQALANILASASKLGISTGGSVRPVDEARQSATTATNLSLSRQTAVLAAAAQHRRDTSVSRRRSNKLQVKYRTS